MKRFLPINVSDWNAPLLGRVDKWN